ncbi:hypothetical protein BDW69DRAFT_178087 [Aspergillus filifer]
MRLAEAGLDRSSQLRLPRIPGSIIQWPAESVKTSTFTMRSTEYVCSLCNPKQKATLKIA